jgi:cytochrome bd-type quinol oxidase subunit 2
VFLILAMLVLAAVFPLQCLVYISLMTMIVLVACIFLMKCGNNFAHLKKEKKKIECMKQ